MGVKESSSSNKIIDLDMAQLRLVNTNLNLNVFLRVNFNLFNGLYFGWVSFTLRVMRLDECS